MTNIVPSAGLLLPSLALSAVACAPLPPEDAPEVGRERIATQFAAETGQIAYFRASISACCSVELPEGAVAAAPGTPIDSIAAKSFKFGSTAINADLTGRNGLPPLTQTRVTRSQSIDEVDGYVNTISTPAREGGRDAVFSVTVICETASCPVAERILGSVEVNGRRVQL